MIYEKQSQRKRLWWTLKIAAIYSDKLSGFLTAVLTVVAAVIFMAAERIPYMPGMQCDRPLCHLLWAFRGYRILFPFNLCILYTYWSMFLHNLWISITYFIFAYVMLRIIMYLEIRKGDTKDANDIHRARITCGSIIPPEFRIPKRYI